MDQENGYRKVRSYVLRAGRLGSGQKQALEQLGSTFCIPFEDREQDLGLLFPKQAPLIVEIGFGMGEATADIAQKFPEYNFVGIEVHTPGVGALLRHIDTKGLTNVRIIQHDAADVVHHMLSAGTVTGFHIFFSDPWPKKRHHKRRLVQPDFASVLAEKLIVGGYVYAVTDWEDHAQHMVAALGKAEELTNAYGGFCESVAWRPKTKFEQKGIAKGHTIREIWVTKQ
ncbi:MAG: tRNA (guanosine(46)-N7)-methyltransferase TrmB [Spirochaetota bacterium]